MIEEEPRGCAASLSFFNMILLWLAQGLEFASIIFPILLLIWYLEFFLYSDSRISKDWYVNKSVSCNITLQLVQ